MDLCAKSGWSRSLVKSLITYVTALPLFGIGVHRRGPLELAVSRESRFIDI